MILPAKMHLTLIAGTLAIAAAGAYLTFMRQHPASIKASSTSQSSPDLKAPTETNATGVVENPPASVTIDGQSVPIKSGTTVVPTAQGSATVTVSAGSVSVNRSESSSDITSSNASTQSGSVQNSNSSSTHITTGGSGNSSVSSSSSVNIYTSQP